MVNSFISTTSSLPGDHALGGSFDAAESSDEEESNGRSVEQEKTITLVGDVRDRTVFLVDDMIDKSGSWIAAAETVVKRGGAKQVYCIATHGLFGGDSLEQMEACDAIDYIVVTNTFPITPQKMRKSKKLVIIDISSLVAESIRRHHYGERFVVLRSHS
jgi:ribose-phosphate pyrophosphokinase